MAISRRREAVEQRRETIAGAANLPSKDRTPTAGRDESSSRKDQS
jgi:hypothetical protein